MKIGILTYYGVHNHGAVLQANALKSVLQKIGHEVSFVSFERNYGLKSIFETGFKRHSEPRLPSTAQINH
ncbi:hypothetical protein LFLT20_00850 [Limosilactobacillus fermentum]|nr:hypothetical protein LFLT20_00850 [Limosilactobacillus fermentum]